MIRRTLAALLVAAPAPAVLLTGAAATAADVPREAAAGTSTAEQPAGATETTPAPATTTPEPEPEPVPPSATTETPAVPSPAAPPAVPAEPPTTTSSPAPTDAPAEPSVSGPAHRQPTTGKQTSAPARPKAKKPETTPQKPASPDGDRAGSASGGAPAPSRRTEASAALLAPTAPGVPSYFIDSFRIPPFLLPIYQAAGVQYGIRWEVLAAINEIETGYGRNLNVSSAGALGWMQFMPSTWRQYGVDANLDGLEDPFNPVDAIFAAARYLRAAGADKDLARAIFAYNHADWYVRDVLRRARLIAALPGDLVDSLTGLTQGIFPVGDAGTHVRGAVPRIAPGGERRRIRIQSRAGSPVTAVTDGTIIATGRNGDLGRYVKLRDAYGNTYTYTNLRSISSEVPIPKPKDVSRDEVVAELDLPRRDPAPDAAASTTSAPADASPLEPVVADEDRPAPGLASGAGADTIIARTPPGAVRGPLTPAPREADLGTPAPSGATVAAPSGADPTASSPITPVPPVIEPPAAEAHDPAATTPTTTAPEPVTTTPEPVTTTPEPVTTTPEPATTTPEPVTTAPEPTSTAPEPTSTAPAPPAQSTTTPEAPSGTEPTPQAQADPAVDPLLPERDPALPEPDEPKPATPEPPAEDAAEQQDDVREDDASRPAQETSIDDRFTIDYGLEPGDVDLAPLQSGRQVIAGTIIGRTGGAGDTDDLGFEIKPAGDDAPQIDPRPIVRGWRLLDSTALYRARAADLKSGSPATVGQIMLMDKQTLQRRVLADPRIEIYSCGRRDIASGGIDRRVLATLEYLATLELKPTVTSLRCGHGVYTSSGNVSHHTTGTAVDIAAINGTPILGHQGKNSITDRTVRRLLQLQGTMRPAQIITLMQYEGQDNTLAMADHADHIHVGFRPTPDERTGTAAPALASALGHDEWNRLIDRLNHLDNPEIPIAPSRYAQSAKRRADRLRRSGAGGDD